MDKKIQILFGKKERFLEKGQSIFDLFETQNFSHLLCARVNGIPRDLSYIPSEGDSIELIPFTEPQGKEIFWHSSAHVLAQAVLRLWPQALPTIGPPIAQGFYYDFANLSISDQDFPLIEKEMNVIIQENLRPKRKEITVEEAISLFSHNPYKVALVKDIPKGEKISIYSQAEFTDLCRGPHLASTSSIGAISLHKLSGAYWRGDAKNQMLTRIYGISFPSKKELKAHQRLLEEAKKRDHKILGPKLDLFSLKEEAPGMPFIHPKGLILWDKILSFVREQQNNCGYVEIKTPSLMTRELWERSGHWANYRDNMYSFSIEERDFAIKPMNCPGCMLFYKGGTKSYRNLPLRIAEIGNVHRYEASGALSGLFRVRSFHQDDAHIFMEKEQLEGEIISALQLVDTIYSRFDLSYHLELSTRPHKSLGSDEDWEHATQALAQAMDKQGLSYAINEGDGAFYGPKIDMHVKDTLGRSWQCGTIQLDMALPERFSLSYTAKDGEDKRPLMIHRAILGSVERFMGILIEHFAGRFPLWLSPLQIRILTVADRHADFANKILKQLQGEGFLCDLDDSSQSLSKKIRSAQMQQINYMLTIGDEEIENSLLSLRSREEKGFKKMSIEELVKQLRSELLSFGKQELQK